MQDVKISIIIPLYNEESVLPLLIVRVKELAGNFPEKIEILLVDDGSMDRTTTIIEQLALTNEQFSAIILSRNFGHQAAISAGLKEACGTDGVFIIDGDLQDPPELLFKFYDHLQQGYEVIYGIRKKRKEGFLLRLCYLLFYRLLNKVSNIKIPLDSGDFCMISRRAVDILNQMPEESRFLRGMRSWLGFSQIGVEYERDGRAAGSPKYNLSKLFSLAINGLFNFTRVPIKFIFLIGLVSMVISSLYLLIALIKKIFYGIQPTGFTGLLSTIVLLSGVQMVSLAIIGEYVSRVFFQTKDRPIYLIKKKIVGRQVNGSGLL
ncbi:MAG: glycosyltransferase family 2 protein [Ferruginibacter sp.]